MKTSRWALENQLDARIKRDQEKLEAALLAEAEAKIAELRANELLDNGDASYAGEY